MSAPQGTEAWLRARRGCATASRFADVLATVKSGEAAGRRNYRTQLVLERLTGEVAESYINDAMQHGTDTEPSARLAFEAKTGLFITETGFIKSAEWIGASPDGFTSDGGGLECKCPNSSTHLATVLSGKMPPEHMAQVQGNMWVCDRPRWHFVSYDPRFPQHLRLFHTVIERDQVYIDALALAVELFLSEVAETVERLQTIKAAA